MSDPTDGAAPPGTRVIVLADDMIWGDRLARAARAAAADPMPVRSLTALDAALDGTGSEGPSPVIVDMTARAYEAIAAIELATSRGARVLAVGQHDDHESRRRARAAGAERVLAYRKLADDGPATIAAWLLADPEGAPAR